MIDHESLYVSHWSDEELRLLPLILKKNIQNIALFSFPLMLWNLISSVINYSANNDNPPSSIDQWGSTNF